MRGSALTRLVARLLLVGVTPLVIACAAAGSGATASPGAMATVTITTAGGEAMAFEPAETVVAATGPIAVTFRNASSLPHNLTFVGIATAATRTIVEPGTSDELLLSPLAQGAYPFVCTIHEGMAGILTVRTP